MPRTTSSQRARRRQRLIELLHEGVEATQEEIVRRLAADGYRATQATISRDLDDVGAIRRHSDGRILYGLPERNGPPTDFGKRVFPELIRSVGSSGNLVVVSTFPGMASTVAAVLDQSEIDGVLGTVAGDDTVLVVADERLTGRKIAKRIVELGAGE